ncbi:MAG TPA: hypothetical protein VGO55_01855 [Allosphingosinicella sp.]|jgi:hypothetical protein|nr:hypothetical protein [Allosphingosinicella sp.]
MIILLTALLAGASPLPQIDRTALDLQARAEALQPRGRTLARTVQRRRAPPARTQATRPRTLVAATPSRSNKLSTPPARGPIRVAAAPLRSTVPGPARRTAARRVSGGSPLDLAQITTICRAAGNQDDPAGFLARLSSAYSLSADDSVSLRASCAAYLAGRADARRASGGTY